ncbi:MAG: hypothetical protein ACRDUY_12635 [Nitriliruptorales bacterium]
MRITGLDATVVAVPFRRDELWAFGGRRGLTSVVLEVHTDEGVTGLGEAAGYPTPEIVLAVIRSLDGLVVGEDPFRFERLSKRIEAIGTWHHVRQTSSAIAAVELACWDIVGKVCGQPLVNLFGGRVRDEVEYFFNVVCAWASTDRHLARRGECRVAALRKRVRNAARGDLDRPGVRRSRTPAS